LDQDPVCLFSNQAPYLFFPNMPLSQFRNTYTKTAHIAITMRIIDVLLLFFVPPTTSAGPFVVVVVSPLDDVVSLETDPTVVVVVVSSSAFVGSSLSVLSSTVLFVVVNSEVVISLSPGTVDSSEGGSVGFSGFSITCPSGFSSPEH